LLVTITGEKCDTKFLALQYTNWIPAMQCSHLLTLQHTLDSCAIW